MLYTHTRETEKTKGVDAVNSIATFSPNMHGANCSCCQNRFGNRPNPYKTVSDMSASLARLEDANQKTQQLVTPEFDQIRRGILAERTQQFANDAELLTQSPSLEALRAKALKANKNYAFQQEDLGALESTANPSEYDYLDAVAAHRPDIAQLNSETWKVARRKPNTYAHLAQFRDALKPTGTVFNTQA